MDRQELLTRADFDAAVTRAKEAAFSYYASSVQVMSDADYDALIDAIQYAHRLNADWDHRGVLDEVAAGTLNTGEVTHARPMLSLAKCATLDEVRLFLAKLGGARVAVEPKVDGVAVRCVYQGGCLVLAATRGNGTAGEDVTSRVRGASGLPARLEIQDELEVRGELYMTDIDFDAANADRQSISEPPFVSPRNAVAGAIRRSDSSQSARLSFAAYELAGAPVETLGSHSARMRQAFSWGIATATSLVPDVALQDDPLEGIRRIAELRSALGFPIDGAVLKADDIALQDSLGAVAGAPRWAAAWKYPADTAETILRDIEVSIGRTGQVGLRAVVDPVFIGGATITHATVHHPAWIQQAGILIDGRVMVYRSGDVIPRITAPVGGPQPREARPWTPPRCCPQCGEAFDTSGMLWRCVTPDCSLVGRVEYFCSRDCMDIDGVGAEVAAAMVESGLVYDVAAIYELTIDQVARLRLGSSSEGSGRVIGRGHAERTIESIAASRRQPLARVIAALGIRKTGRRISRRLAEYFQSLEALRSATVADLMQVDGIAEDKAAAIHDGLLAMSDVIDRLIAAGVTTSTERATPERDLPLAGLTIVVTGAMTGPLRGLTRTEIHELIERAGGRTSDTVSADTSLLVCAKEGSSKHARAVRLGVPVETPEAFADRLGSVGPEPMKGRQTSTTEDVEPHMYEMASRSTAGIEREMVGRYFEFVGADSRRGTASAKFWEVTVEGSAVIVRYGKLGTQGQSKTTEYASEDAAYAEAEKLASAKVRKGYVEKDSPGRHAR